MSTNGYTNSKHICIFTQFCRWPGIISTDHDDMAYMARKLNEEYEKWGLAINLEKTKYVCMGERKEILKFDGGEK